MRKRLPPFPDVLQVYAVIAVLLSGWTITAFLWRLSAWMLLLSLGEISVIFSYAMAANFLESLLILLVLLAVSIVLPPHFLRDDFAVRGSILAMGLVITLMTFVGSHMVFGVQGGLGLYIAPLLATGATVVFLAIAARWRTAVLALSDRLTVFLFILLPLFVMSSVYVLFRNLS